MSFESPSFCLCASRSTCHFAPRSETPEPLVTSVNHYLHKTQQLQRRHLKALLCRFALPQLALQDCGFLPQLVRLLLSNQSEQIYVQRDCRTHQLQNKKKITDRHGHKTMRELLPPVVENGTTSTQLERNSLRMILCCKRALCVQKY